MSRRAPLERTAAALAIGALSAAGCLLTFSPPPAPGAIDGAVEGGASVEGGDGASTSDGAPGAEGAPGDGSPDADAAALPTPTWTFADGFESGDSTRWSGTYPAGNGASAAVVDAGAHAGCCALRLQTPSGAKSWAYVAEDWTHPVLQQKAPVLTSGTIAVREWIKIASLDRDTREVAANFGGANPEGGSGISAGIGLIDSSHWGWGILQIEPDGGSQGGTGVALPSGLDVGHWHCAEIVFNVSAAKGRVSVFVDGSPSVVSELQGDTTLPGGYDAITAGLSYTSGASGASSLDLDDAVVSLYADLSPTVHIGCTP